MKKTIVISALCISLLAAAVFAARVIAKTCDELVAEAEELWLEGKLDESDKALEEAIKMSPDRAELYWRKARNEYDRIEAIPRDKKPGKDILIARYRGIEALAEKCSSLDKNDGNCWLWKGIGMGRRGTTQGILNSLTEADDLEDVFLKTIELKPQYRAKDGSANALGDAYNALGQFYRVVPEWLCTFGIKQVVGTCGDLDKSVELQRKAVAREPKRIEYNKELGVSLLCHGQKREKPAEIEEGKRILNDLQSYPAVKPTDQIDKEHARMLIEDPSLACGYSRDAQQEQSQEAYQKE